MHTFVQYLKLHRVKFNYLCISEIIRNIVLLIKFVFFL